MEKTKFQKSIILVIDDNPVNLRTMKVFLESRFEVIPVKSGTLGFEVLKTRQIDLILLDIEMPVMSGFEFMKQLKATPAFGNIPVVCVTAHDATPEFISSVIHAGAKDFVTKPFEPLTLQNKVIRALNLNEYVLES
ncbi:MAG: response regulator [Spirochaetaceae bacterium]|jgi:CheY-like chemotaxis protein|nr:response regulator [Spirochaetaceae bacterium]